MKVRLRIDTGFARAQHQDEIEIDDSELEGIQRKKKEEYINKEYVEPFLYEHVEAWYEEIKD